MTSFRNKIRKVEITYLNSSQIFCAVSKTYRLLTNKTMQMRILEDKIRLKSPEADTLSRLVNKLSEVFKPNEITVSILYP